MAEPFKLKEFFNVALVDRMASDIHDSWPKFDRNGFVKTIVPQLNLLELKQRADLITHTLKDFLPPNYPEALKALEGSWGPEINGDSLEGMSSFYYMPHAHFVAYYGLDHFEISMNALKEITKRFTSEFAIRFFILAHQKRTMVVLNKWVTDPNLHVRRLVSEGTRPRLPWAQRLPEFQKDPTPVLALLEKLKDDPELYVRRSVANNLNDIMKDHPELVVEVLERWQKSENADTQWIVKHASRTLIKQGHPAALVLRGYSPDIKVEVSNLKGSSTVVIGGYLNFSFSVKSLEKKKAELMIDYVVHYMKANGQHSEKVFKLSACTLAGGATSIFKRKLSFEQRTTRKHYPGAHYLEIQINGQRHGRLNFEVIA